MVPQWAHFGHGWIWITLIFIIAFFSLGRGFLQHKKPMVLITASIGLSFLILGSLLEGKLSVIAESVMFVTGGLLLSYSHWQNYKLLARCKR